MAAEIKPIFLLGQKTILRLHLLDIFTLGNGTLSYLLPLQEKVDEDMFLSLLYFFICRYKKEDNPSRANQRFRKVSVSFSYTKLVHYDSCPCVNFVPRYLLGVISILENLKWTMADILISTKRLLVKLWFTRLYYWTYIYFFC